MDTTQAKLSPRPFYAMAKPAGASCNLRCAYCYYAEKAALHEAAAPAAMDDGLLETFVRQYIEAQPAPDVLFTWHGGEPLLRPLSFYRRAVGLQRRYAGGRRVDNCIQTNGTLLDDEWCRFFRDEGFLVGISIDGPRRLHDPLRQGSFDRGMRGVELLARHGVEWNARATVNSLNAPHPAEFYRFFRSIGCAFLQFTPVVERTDPATGRLMPGTVEGGQPTPESLSAAQWGEFACGVFDEWVKADVGEVFVRLFDDTLANWAGEPPGGCSLAPLCGQAPALEANGDLYSCDHFVFPAFRLGNIRSRSMAELMSGRAQLDFGRRKSVGLPRRCRRCRWLFACHGECPRNRFVRDEHGAPGLNYLCEGYRMYFAHVAPYMDFMKGELDAGRPPANVMREVALGHLPPAPPPPAAALGCGETLM